MGQLQGLSLDHLIAMSLWLMVRLYAILGWIYTLNPHNTADKT